MSTELEKAVFFDRDGVLDVDKGYIYRPEELEWVEGAREAVALLRSLGDAIYVVTNQSGIARGFYTKEQMDQFHAHMNAELAKAGGKIDGFYHCPHHPTKGVIPELTVACGCRKPEPGMLLQAMEEHPIDRHASFLIGDKASDVEAALAAGVPGYRFTGKNLLTFVRLVLRRQKVHCDC